MKEFDSAFQDPGGTLSGSGGYSLDCKDLKAPLTLEATSYKSPGWP